MLSLEHARNVLQSRSAKHAVPARVCCHPFQARGTGENEEERVSLSRRAVEEAERLIILTELPAQLADVPCIGATGLELLQDSPCFVVVSALRQRTPKSNQREGTTNSQFDEPPKRGYRLLVTTALVLDPADGIIPRRE